MRRLVLYLPVSGARADRYEAHARRWSRRHGDHIVEVTDKPGRVRELLAAGLVDAVAVVAQRHRLDLPELPVVEIPHPRPGEALAGAGLSGLGAWLADQLWEHEAAAAVASVLVAATAGTAVAVAATGGTGAVDHAAPSDVVPVERPAPPVPLPRPAMSSPAAVVAPAPTPSPESGPEPTRPIGTLAPAGWSTPPPTASLTVTPTPATVVSLQPTADPAPAATPSDDQRCLVDLEVAGLDLQVCAR